jgi:hypothetical protein
VGNRKQLNISASKRGASVRPRLRKSSRETAGSEQPAKFFSASGVVAAAIFTSGSQEFRRLSPNAPPNRKVPINHFEKPDR